MASGITGTSIDCSIACSALRQGKEQRAKAKRRIRDGTPHKGPVMRKARIRASPNIICVTYDATVILSKSAQDDLARGDVSPRGVIPRSHTRIFLTIPYGSPIRSQSQASVNNSLRSVYNSSQHGDFRNDPWKQRQIFYMSKIFLRSPTDWFFRKSFGNNT